jgi:hypothetical protein
MSIPLFITIECQHMGEKLLRDASGAEDIALV